MVTIHTYYILLVHITVDIISAPLSNSFRQVLSGDGSKYNRSFEVIAPATNINLLPVHEKLIEDKRIVDIETYIQ